MIEGIVATFYNNTLVVIVNAREAKRFLQYKAGGI